MKNSKKAFTIVELVIVIAVVAILAAVIIPALSGVVEAAEDSRYLSERTNFTISDTAEKVTDETYLTWKELEVKIVEKLITETISTSNASDLSQGYENTGLDAENIVKMFGQLLKGKFTDVQIEKILQNDGKSDDEIKEALSKLPQTGITQSKLTTAIVDSSKTDVVIGNLPQKDDIPAIAQAILDGIGNNAVTPSPDPDPTPDPEPDTVTGITLDKASAEIAVGEKVTLIATTTPNGGAVEWTSSDDAIAMVENGVVTGVSAGTATITATSGGHSASSEITVTSPTVSVTGITLSASTLTLYVGAYNGQLTATVSPDNATDKTVTWSSNAESVATVDSNGYITPISNGTAVITATAGEIISTTCTVTVDTANIVAYSGVEFDTDTGTVISTSGTPARFSTLKDALGDTGYKCYVLCSNYEGNITISRSECEDHSVYIDLNGHDIMAKSGNVIEISEYTVLNIFDSSSSNVEYHGNIKGKAGKKTRGIQVDNNGILYLYGGRVANNTYNDNGAGIYNLGTVNMRGGKICNNTVDTSDGGGIYNGENGVFNMCGGIICHNEATNGGGIYNNSGTTIISGGVIYGNDVGDDLNNIASHGTAVYKNGGSVKYGNNESIINSNSGEYNSTITGHN